MLIKFIIIIIISAVCLSKCCKYSWFIVFLLVQLPVKGGGGVKVNTESFEKLVILKQ